MPESTVIARERIRRDGGTQPRAAIVEHVVADYAEAIAGGASLPDVTVFYDGKDYWLADGFHRDAAHERLGLAEISCDVRAGTRRDAVLFACGANETHGLRRTNEDKRRAVWILLADEEWAHWSDREIAARCRVSHTFVARLRPELNGNVAIERTFVTRHGTVATRTLSQPDPAAEAQRAAQIATIKANPGLLYEALLGRQDVAARVAGEMRAEKQAAKKVRRAEREQDLAASIINANEQLEDAIAAGKRYGVILADPEWRNEPWSRESGMDRAADNHYPTSPTPAICARPIGEIAADDCVLALWATVPMLLDGLQVMAAWGFTYKSHAIWLKDRAGTGYWFRNRHEIVLIGTRGNPPCPAMGEQWESVFGEPVGPHSVKPGTVHELIEAYFPNLPKIELNARAARPGWDVWGAEAPEGMACGGVIGPGSYLLGERPSPHVVGVDLAAGPDMSAEVIVRVEAGCVTVESVAIEPVEVAVPAIAQGQSDAAAQLLDIPNFLHRARKPAEARA